VNQRFHRFTGRFFLNLRSIASQQRPSVFESQAVPSEPFTVRTHPVWKQSSQLATNDFELEMGKTAYRSGANPNKGEIQTDVIGLDVTVSRAHHKEQE